MKSILIVLVKGTKFKKFDRFQLKAMSILEKLTRNKLRNYKWFITSKFNQDYKFVTNVVLNLDDPAYSDSEIKNLLLWEQNLKDVLSEV